MTRQRSPWPMKISAMETTTRGLVIKTIQVFSEALSNRYGNRRIAEDLPLSSKCDHRGRPRHLRGYSRNKRADTLIQWRLNMLWKSGSGSL